MGQETSDMRVSVRGRDRYEKRGAVVVIIRSSIGVGIDDDLRDF